MLTVSALTRPELDARLGRGIVLQTGAFATRLRSTIASVADGIGLLYADYPVLERDAFADFHLRLARPANLRRWLRPQVLLMSDEALPFKPLPLNHAFPMFEWGLNWCVSTRAHRYLVIHAAVIEKDGRAAILPAPSGSGKSTLCAALVHHGWRLLSDELALVRRDDGHIVPLPRPISLKNESIALMQRYLRAPTFGQPVTGTDKGTVAHLKAPADSIARGNEAARPAWVIFPRYEAGAAAKLEALPRARAHMGVAQNAFNYSLMGLQGFQTLGEIMDQSESFTFTYSALDDAIDVFSRLTPAHP